MKPDQPLPRITQTQLDDAIRRHRFFAIGKQGGARAVFKFSDLSGLDFHGADLSGADFSGSSLKGCTLTRGIFTGAAFFGCNFDEANLEWANFSRADLRGASFNQTRLGGADVATADLRGGIVLNTKPAEPDKVRGLEKIDYAEKITERQALTDLSRKDEPQRASALDLSQADDDFQRLAAADLSVVTGPNRTVPDLVLRGDVETQRVSGLSLEEKADPLLLALHGHARWIESGGKAGRSLDVSGQDLRGVKDLGRYPLMAIKARGANFSGLNLSGAHLQSAVLEDCDFTGSNLSKADLRGSNLRNANLTYANLDQANLGVLIFGNRRQATDLTGAVLTGTSLADPS